MNPSTPAVQDKTSSPSRPRVYFPNLNGLRFIAALLVIVHHLEQLKSILGFSNYWEIPFVKTCGKLGVVLFFVLSGFLITYLLLVEFRTVGSISIKRFFIRRTLRIWPLYYLIILLGLLVLPHISFIELESTANISQDFAKKFTLFLVFLPNLALVLYPAVPFIAQAWSVGVEEQCYIVWPLLARSGPRRLLLKLCGVILGYLTLNKVVGFLASRAEDGHTLNVLSKFLASFSVDCMAIGGIFALLLFEERAILKRLYSRTLQAVVLLLLVALISTGQTFPHLNYEIYSLLFGILVLNLAANKGSIISLEREPFNYLGKISYGLYMYHPVAIVVTLRTCEHFGLRHNALVYPLTLLLSIGLSAASYHLFEKWFIARKKRFSSVLSGDNAASTSKDGKKEFP